MMSNLFSTFDPSTNIMNLSINWMSSFIGMMIVPMMFLLVPSRMNSMSIKMSMSLHIEFKTLLGINSKVGTTMMLISLFVMIMFNNFVGLFPYVFTSTSHMSMTFSQALPLSMCFMLLGWINNMNHMFMHMVPQGTPWALMSFMFLIEMISNIIRPGTLAIRLAATMIAGHLLLTLMGNKGPIISYQMITFLLMAQVLLLMLESAVTIIPAYVFSILRTLYSSEVH